MPRKRSTQKLIRLQELYRKINSQLSKIERKLLSALKRFYNKYIRGSINPVDIIRQQRGGYIMRLIMRAIKSIHGNDSFDFNEFRELAVKQYEQFWKTVSKLRMREDELKTINPDKVVPAGVIPEKVYKPALDIEASLLGFSGWLTFAAFNTSMLFIALNSTDPRAAAIIIPQVTFMTVGDKKVDKKICRPLHGRTFNVNDPLTPKPPLHLFCRCMLLPT